MDHDPETATIPANAQRAEDVALPTDAADQNIVLKILAQRINKKNYSVLLS